MYCSIKLLLTIGFLLINILLTIPANTQEQSRSTKPISDITTNISESHSSNSKSVQRYQLVSKTSELQQESLGDDQRVLDVQPSLVDFDTIVNGISLERELVFSVVGNDMSSGPIDVSLSARVDGVDVRVRPTNLRLVGSEVRKIYLDVLNADYLRQAEFNGVIDIVATSADVKPLNVDVIFNTYRPVVTILPFSEAPDSLVGIISTKRELSGFSQKIEFEFEAKTIEESAEFYVNLEMNNLDSPPPRLTWNNEPIELNQSIKALVKNSTLLLNWPDLSAKSDIEGEIGLYSQELNFKERDSNKMMNNSIHIPIRVEIDLPLWQKIPFIGLLLGLILVSGSFIFFRSHRGEL